MAERERDWGLLGAFVALIVLFLLSLPGFGIETRKFTDYAAWAGPIFLVLTILVFAGAIGGAVGAAMGRSWAGIAGYVAGLAAVVSVALDSSGVGGPKPPAGPFVLGVVVLLLGLVIVWLSWRFRCPCDDEPDGETKPTSV